MLQIPKAIPVTRLPLTEQILAVEVLKASGRPEEEEAEILLVTPTRIFGIVPNVMVWLPPILIDCVFCGAGL